MQGVREVKNRVRGMRQIKVEGMKKEKSAANSNACWGRLSRETEDRESDNKTAN